MKNNAKSLFSVLVIVKDVRQLETAERHLLPKCTNFGFFTTKMYEFCFFYYQNVRILGFLWNCTNIGTSCDVPDVPRRTSVNRITDVRTDVTSPPRCLGHHPLSEPLPRKEGMTGILFAQKLRRLSRGIDFRASLFEEPRSLVRPSVGAVLLSPPPSPVWRYCL